MLQRWKRTLVLHLPVRMLHLPVWMLHLSECFTRPLEASSHLSSCVIHTCTPGLPNLSTRRKTQRTTRQAAHTSTEHFRGFQSPCIPWHRMLQRWRRLASFQEKSNWLTFGASSCLWLNACCMHWRLFSATRHLSIAPVRDNFHTPSYEIPNHILLKVSSTQMLYLCLSVLACICRDLDWWDMGQSQFFNLVNLRFFSSLTIYESHSEAGVQESPNLRG